MSVYVRAVGSAEGTLYLSRVPRVGEYVPAVHVAVSPEAVDEVPAPLPTPEEMAATYAYDVQEVAIAALDPLAALAIGVGLERTRAATREAALVAEVEALRSVVADAKRAAVVYYRIGADQPARNAAVDAVCATLGRVEVLPSPDVVNLTRELAEARAALEEQRRVTFANAHRFDLEADVLRTQVRRRGEEADGLRSEVASLETAEQAALAEVARLRAEHERDRLDLAEYRAAQRDRV